MPILHNRDTVAKMAHCVDVMRNEDDGQSQTVAQFAEKGEYLHADGNVQRADSFIGDENF